MERFGDIVARVEQVRTALRLSRARFAREIGLRPQTYNNFVGAQGSRPSVALIRGIVAHLNVDANWLLTGKGEPFAEPGDRLRQIQPSTNLQLEVASDEKGRRAGRIEAKEIELAVAGLRELSDRVDAELKELQCEECSAIQRSIHALTVAFASNPEGTSSGVRDMLEGFLKIVQQRRGNLPHPGANGSN